MTPKEYADLRHGKRPKKRGAKKQNEQRLINWTSDSRAREPYILGMTLSEYHEQMRTIEERDYNSEVYFNSRVVFGNTDHRTASGFK